MDMTLFLIGAGLIIILLWMLRVLEFFKTVIQYYLIDNPVLFHWKKIDEYSLEAEVRHIEQSPFYGPTAIHLQKLYESSKDSSTPSCRIFTRMKGTDTVVYARKDIPVISDTSPKVIVATYEEYHRMGKTMLWMKSWRESEGPYKVLDPTVSSMI